MKTVFSMNADYFVREIPQKTRVIKNISAMNCRNSAGLCDSCDFRYKKFILIKELLPAFAVWKVALRWAVVIKPCKWRAVYRKIYRIFWKGRHYFHAVGIVNCVLACYHLVFRAHYKNPGSCTFWSNGFVVCSKFLLAFNTRFSYRLMAFCVFCSSASSTRSCPSLITMSQVTSCFCPNRQNLRIDWYHCS